MGDEKGALGNVTSGIGQVAGEGAQRRALVSRATGAIFILLGIIIVVAIPGMALTWTVVLVSLVLMIGIIATYLDDRSSPARRKDHLAFSVVVSVVKESTEAEGDGSVAFYERVARSVKGYLNQNRISNTELERSKKPMKMRQNVSIFSLNSWSAELNVRPGDARTGRLSAKIAVGPLTPATDAVVMKMMEGLKQELEREFWKKPT